MAEQKTNVMRLLEQKKIKYKAYEYPHTDAAVDGVSVAESLGQPVRRVFKTLVARGASKKIYVFDIPVASCLMEQNRFSFCVLPVTSGVS